MAEHLDFVAGTGVVLELTQQEAQVLMDITGRIGGLPDTTRRGLVDNIGRALYSAGCIPCCATDISKTRRSIYFLTEKEIKNGDGIDS